jgi:radical SAM superfamily enzyme YgiQ (UPF0313 family)
VPDIVLSTLNARYSHASFGLRYLLANMGALQDRTAMLEFDLRRKPEDIAALVLAARPQVVGIGVYIWNAALSTEVARCLKASRPDVVLVVGGPEVSHEYDQQEVCNLADYVITGEADFAFRDLCARILAGDRPGQKVIAAHPVDVAKLSLPYTLYSDEDIAHRVIYVEASRGCPFTCEFCLSSLDVPLRRFPIEPLLAEFQSLLDRGVQEFKFVDRTFNLSIPYSLKLLEFFLARHRPGLFLHFEMIPDRLPEALRDIITSFPPGTLQFEVGIQTFNEEVAARIKRRQNYEKTAANLEFLLQESESYIHADLIAGLPGESLESFAAGFDRLLALGPHEIQVNLLKRLRGTPIVRHDAAFAMEYSPAPPYELVRNRDLDTGAIAGLKRFARFWDLLANSGNFAETAPMIWSGAPSPFHAIAACADALHARFGRTHGIALDDLAEALLDELVKSGREPAQVAQSLARDYARCGRMRMPVFLKRHGIRDGEVRSAPTTRLKRQARHVANHSAFIADVASD